MKRKQTVDTAEGGSAGTAKKPKSPGATAMMTSVAHVGEQFTFSHLAAVTYFESISFVARSALAYCPQTRLADVFEAVRTGACAYGVLRIESSSVGTVYSVYDMLLKNCEHIAIVGEIGETERISVCGAARVPVPDKDIARVYGRSDMLMASGDYLDAVDAKRTEAGLPVLARINSHCPATAVSQDAAAGSVALCSAAAGTHYGLTQVHANVSNDRNSQCRYIVIAKTDAGILHDPLLVGQPELHSQRKTSIVLALDNSPGAIFKMSSVFALRDIGILKIESRPATTALHLNEDSNDHAYTKKHWNLIFYLDIKPSPSEKINEAALKNLEEFCPWFKVLGTYESRLLSTEAAVGESWASILDVLEGGGV
jgi:prephenate dehydratase